MGLGDPGRTNSSMEPGPGENIELRWVRRIGDYGNTSLYAYDRFTGEPLCHVELPPSSQHTGIAVFGDTVLVPLDSGQIGVVGPGAA